MKSTSQFLRQLGFTGPGVLVNEHQARANIRSMAEKSRRAGVTFRPHFKTHQSADVGQWFAQEGVTAITVSSVSMAEYFACHGWRDITIAFLLNPLQWPRIESLAHKLAEQGGQLGLTVDSPAAAATLAERPELPLRVWLKIDTGYGRTGVPWQNGVTMQEIVEALGPHPLTGLLTHSGDSYQASSLADLNSIWILTRQRLETVSQNLGGEKQLSLSVGDTPCCHSIEDLSGVQEIRPGNFVFFDLMQWSQGVCQTQELAAAAVCPVVGLYPERGHMVVHGGAVHLSRESLVGEKGKTVFGYLGTLSRRDDGSVSQQVLTDFPVVSLSQEHGTVKISAQNQTIFESFEIGDLGVAGALLLNL